MRKLLFVSLMMLGVSAQAEPIAVDLGKNTFYAPLQVVNATQLYSIDEGRGYPAVETILVSRGDGQLTFGAAPVLGTSKNVPFVGLHTKLSPRFFDTSDNDLYFGLWAGKPSNEKEWQYGIKASISLW